jgi:hypothetical protein
VQRYQQYAEGTTMKPRLTHHHEQGQSVVIIALAIVVLVGMAGLGLDGANAFNQRRNAVNASDAAAMAGTNTLIEQRKAVSGSNSAVCQSVVDYFNEHKLNQGANMVWTASYVDAQAQPVQQFCDSSASPIAVSGFASSNVKGVAVDVKYTFTPLFMPVLGRNELTVSGAATAIYGPLGSTTGSNVVPFTVSETAIDAIKDDGEISVTKLGAGNFGSIEFNPDNVANATSNDCNSSTYQDTQSYYWCNGSPKYPVYEGEVLPGNTGMVATSLEDEILTHQDQIIIIPVFEGGDSIPTSDCKITNTCDNGGASKTYTIIGFLAVRLNSVKLTGANEDRNFNVSEVAYYASTGALNPNAKDTGVYAINLVK